MSDTENGTAARWLLPAIIGLVGGFAGAAGYSYSGLGTRVHGEQMRQYLLANPDILPEVFERLQQKEMQARLAPLGSDLETAFPGAVLGNPNGSVTLVEFSDYACGYCRGAVDDVEALIAQNPDLKVVVREYPILSQGSADAARMALAAAEQGKFADFHRAMFDAGRPTPDAIEQAAASVGVDLDKAREAIGSGKYDAELMKNNSMARELGIDGTPGWVIGGEIFVGAVGQKQLADSIDKTREEADS